MNELYLGLMGLGALAVGAVVVYNKWQERKLRQRADQTFRSRHEDILMGTPSEPEPAPVPHPSSDRRIEPVLEELPGAPIPPVEPQDEPVGNFVSHAPGPVLNEALDYIINIESPDAIASGYLIDAQAEALANVTKPVHWEAYSVAFGGWERLAAESPVAYRRLRVGLQLADRKGPATHAELTEFCSSVQVLSADLLAVASMSDQAAALAQALDLDGFCAEVDVQIGINVICAPGQPFVGTKVRALAEAAGLQLEQDGRFYRRNDDGSAQFSMLNLDQAPFQSEHMKDAFVNGITVLLDVPRVADGARVFDMMAEFVRQFASAAKGIVVDDNRRSLNDVQIGKIREQLVAFQGKMERRGMPAGSDQASRLFA